MTSQFPDMTWSSNFFWCCFVSLVKFSYWCKFHVIITGSAVITISFYKGLTRNPEIRNTLVWVLPNIWRLGQGRNTKFGTSISNKMLMYAAKCQGCSSFRLWVIKGKPTEGVKLPPFPPKPPSPPSPPPSPRYIQIRVKALLNKKFDDFNKKLVSIEKFDATARKVYIKIEQPKRK